MSTYRAYQVTGQHRFELVDREAVPPSAGHVRFRAHTCGVCHSDMLGVEGMRDNPGRPIVPGHEVVGVIDAVGDGVTAWQVGDRVGLGFLGGHCGECEWCRRGDFVNCENQPQPGTTEDGGYAEVVYARASGLVRIPDSLKSRDASPLLCAGITTFNALRNLDVEPDALVAIQGIGGLGHLGVQYANKLGYRVAAIARGTEKATLATQLGAHHYIDSQAEDPAAALQKLGGARAIVATVTSGEAMAEIQGGLGVNGTLMVIGAVPSLNADTLFLLRGRRSIKGWYSGVASDSEDTLAFSQLNGVQSMKEIYPLSRAGEAYDRMMSGQARFRVVLTMEG